MNRKKLFSAAVAGALVAAQMVMPVMAGDTGTVQVPVTTKTAVIRVEVPTKLVIAVDQFEMEDSGTQIYSEVFKMKNLSEIDVKVSVESTATLGTDTTLVGTKAAAENSTEEGEAWIAIAAQSAAGNYDDPKTDTSDADATPAVADTPETIATLTETNSNVVTFVQESGATTATASQDFYLEKGTAPVGYKLLNIGEASTEISYAQFYLLTSVEASTVFDGTGDDAALQALVDAGDVYHTTTASIDDGVALTKIKKGTSGQTYTSTETYYTVAPTVTAKANLDPTKPYVYGGTATPSAKGEAAFRYIGKLSEEQETWSEADISNVNITYTIVGVTQSRYDDVKDDCEYGLYYGGGVAASAPDIETKAYNYDRTADLSISVTLGSGSLAATDIQSLSWSSTKTGDYTDFAKGTKWTYADGTVTFKSGTWGSGSVGDKKYLKVTFNDTDATPVVLEITISK